MPGDDLPGAPDKTHWRRDLVFYASLLLGVFGFQSAVARPHYIPSDSMMPALLSGDRLVASKYAYGWSYASPAIQLTGFHEGRLLGRMPERGDIATVLRQSDGEVLIKRVIGLPGDTIEMHDGILRLNGRDVPRVARGAADIKVDANLPCDGRYAPFRQADAAGVEHCRLPVFRETLPNGVSYDTIDLSPEYVSPGDNYGPATVPAGHVFLMGDNRDNSADSRYPLTSLGLGGPVPWESLGGRAEFITHSFDGSWGLRGDRMGTSLRPEKPVRP